MAEAKIRKVVIPAAGLGTRLLPATKSQPKEMLPVGRKPVIQYVVEEMLDAGLHEVLLITGPGKRALEDHFDRDCHLRSKVGRGRQRTALDTLDASHDALDLFYVRQRRANGTGGALLHAEAFVDGEAFVVAFGDSILRTNKGVTGAVARRLVQTHVERRAAVTIAVQEVSESEVVQYGVVRPAKVLEPGRPFRIAGLVEKPRQADAPSRFVIAARFVFSASIFESLRTVEATEDGEVRLTDGIQELINRGQPVWCVPLLEEERRFDIGNFQSYFEAFCEFALTDGECGPRLREHVHAWLHGSGQTA